MSPHHSSHPLDLADIQELVEEAMTGDKGNTLTVEYKVSIVSHTGWAYGSWLDSDIQNQC